MAWAEKLPSGKYRGVYRDAHGKRRSAGTFTHKPKAERAAAAREEQARKTMRRDPEAFKRSWKSWCDEWWPTRNVEASTLKIDAGRRDRHLMPMWRDEPIGAITRQDVKAWAARMASDGVGPTTVQRCVHLFSASMVAAVDAEIIDANPAARIKLPGSPKAQERFLTREKYATLLDHMPTDMDRLVLEVGVHTGLRPGEWAGLHWNRVDLDRGLIRVVETFDESGGRMKAYPKSKKVRDVPLTAELVERLRAERDSRGDLRDGCKVPHAVGECRSSLVLRTAGGSVLRNSNWSPKWRASVIHADIGHVRPYDMRHTYASWLLQAGVPLAEVGRLMGHVSPQTTAIYAHLAAPPNEAVRAALAGSGLAAPRKPHAAAKTGS